MDYNKIIDGLIASELKNHQAELIMQGAITELIVREPDTSVFAMRYWFRSGLLCVSGDAGDGIYQWHYTIGDIMAVATCNPDYFASKCLASPYGPGFKSWDEKWAREHLEWLLKEESPKSENIRNCMFNNLYSQATWNEWLNDNGEEIFGDDYWELYSIGMAIDGQCLLHLAGLRIAKNQLDGDGE